MVWSWAMAFQHEHASEQRPLTPPPSMYVGEDREALTKVDRKLTEEEEKKMKQVHVIDGVKRVVEKILGRRKLKSSYEYEVQWVGTHPDQNTYIPRDELVQMGFEKLVNECDAKEAAAMVSGWVGRLWEAERYAPLCTSLAFHY